MRKTTNGVLDALIKAAEGVLHGQGRLSLDSLKEIVARLETSPDFDDFYRRAYREVMDIVEAEKREQRRADAFGRLIIHPLNPMLNDGPLNRGLLPNIFSFIHLVLGEDADTYGERCRDIVQSLRDSKGDEYGWDDFYEDDRAKLVLWHTLVRIAASFKRWDVRKEWFIKLMHYRPTTISLGSNTFVTRDHDHAEEPRVFGEREFCLFFQALFEPLKSLGPKDEALFRHEFGSDPHHLIGPFLVHLTMCQVG